MSIASSAALIARDHADGSSPIVSRRGSRPLRVSGVSKSFTIEGKTLPVLEDVDLHAAPGSFISIVGASGCGKSTLLRLIAGLDRQFTGDIHLDGRPVEGPGPERGVVFQEHRLFPWLTVTQNVAVGLSAARLPEREKRALALEQIRLVGLEGFENAYPRQLSGGMAQRAAIARALVSKPEILLLDEPLGALDALTRMHLQNELARLWSAEGVTIILVTHDIEEAVFLGQQVIVLGARPGRVKRRLSVDLPYPRDRADPQLTAIKQELLAEFQVGAARLRAVQGGSPTDI
jgi:ABC-type nitrate/sulfonate/bicarbonate transport system ATPase subunit